MNKLRCIAIDDEPFALEMLADDIARVPFLELVGQFASPLDALDTLRQQPVDLLFLDIQMPTLTGVQFLRTLPQRAGVSAPMVMFTTAYEQYALEGYELDVVDYLLKPIPFERFLKAVNKAYDRFALRQPPPAPAPPDAPSAATPPPARGYFFIFSEYREIKLYFDQVLYVEGLKDYVKIFVADQARPFLSRLTLKAVEARLPAESFCRVHKSFIVSLDKISSFQRTKIFVGKQEIPVGSSYVDEFERKYGAG